MNRRRFLKTTAACATTSLLHNITHAAETVKPNIIFIMVDDLGPEWISCYGGREMQTPNIDRLARTGLLFQNAYSMPQCTPTRVTLLTGQYPWRHGWANHWDVPRWGAGCHFDWRHNMSFPRLLKKAGYATAAAGKWQINDFRVTPDAMKKHGFDDWCMWTGYESQNPPSAKRYWNPYLNTPAGSKTYKDRFSEDIFTDFLIDFMTANRDKSFCLYYPMCLTHSPFTTTPADPEVTGKIDRHKVMVRYVDICVGRLIDALEKLGLRKNTVLIFTTDNGSGGGLQARMNGRPIKGGKGTLGEAGCRAPFIACCPGLVPEGKTTDCLTDFTDLLPTFAELAGAKVPENLEIDGKSIAQVLLGKSQDGPREWIMALGHGPALLTEQGVVPKQKFTDRVVRDKRYKLWILDAEPAKFYDLKTDPHEENNLIDSADPGIVAARKKLEAVVANCPEKDAAPRYTPTPPQPWDKKPDPNAKRK